MTCPGHHNGSAHVTRLATGAVLSLCWLVLSVQGIDNTWRNRYDIETAAQWLMSLAQVGYAIMGVVVVLLWWARSSWVRPALLWWAGAFVTAVTLILPAWSPEDQALVPRFFMGALAVAGILGGCGWYSSRGHASAS